MKKHSWPAALLVVSAILLVGCESKLGPTTVTVELKVRDDGTMNRDDHRAAVVFPGDKLRFTCACPPGAEFWVTDLEHLGELGHTADQILALNQILAEASEPPMAAAEGAGEAAEVAAAARLAVMAERLEAVRHHLTEMRGEPIDNLDRPFGEGWEDRPTPGSEAILTGPYAVERGDHLMKYTWVLRQGDVEERWDPHIAGHERRK